MTQVIATPLQSDCVFPPGRPACQVVARQSLSPEEREDWDRFVFRSPSATLFHLSGWQAVVEGVLRHKTFYLFAHDGDGIRGVFPVSWIKNRLFGDCLVSSPLAVYGGVSARDEESHTSLLQAGAELARRLGVQYLEMRNRADAFESRLPSRDLYVTFTQDLTPGADKLLQRLPRDTRYLIRKSEKAGLEWVEDLPLDTFYNIFARSVHRLGTPVFSPKLFTALREEFPGASRVFGVRKGAAVIAGVFCFYFKDQVLPYYAGALPEFYKDSPNNFMYWNLIKQSCREGFRVFDFGRSKRGTGSFHFKSSWSMEVSELPYRYQLVRARSVPHMSPVDPKFQLPVSLWKQMPFGWTKILGPRVVPWIPSV